MLKHLFIPDITNFAGSVITSFIFFIYWISQFWQKCVPISDLLRNSAKLQQPKGVALRWAVNANGEGSMQLLLQALPSHTAIINARPAFKRDSCLGISVVNLNLSIEIDYNLITTGPTSTLFSSNPDTTKQILSTSRSARINTIKNYNKNCCSLLLLIKNQQEDSKILHSQFTPQIP